MKSNQRTKIAVPETEQGDDVIQVDRPIWFLGREIKGNPTADKSEAPAPKAARVSKPLNSVKAKEPARREPDKAGENPSEERRLSPLEAYMRYAKMREPQEDDQLAPIESKGFQSGRREVASDGGIDWADEAPRRRPRRRASRRFKLRDALFAGIASIAVGVVGGAVVYDRANDGELSQTVSDSIAHFLTGLDLQSDAVAANAGAIAPANGTAPASFKKPVTTARLDVNDARGDVNTPIPLSISAEPAVPDQVIALRLTGLPADAYLTAGIKLANNSWLLKPGEATGVKLMVPKAESSSLLIAVDAIEPRTGDLAAPTEEINVALNTAATSQVQPVSAPATDAVKRNFNLPPAEQSSAQPPVEPTSVQQHESAAEQPLPATAPVESDKKPGVADSATLMRNGEKLFDVGDFVAARSFFSRARELGDREASLHLGKTYDPVVFVDRNVQGLKPDPTMALKYYLEARTAGIDDADNAINGLETWLKQ